MNDNRRRKGHSDSHQPIRNIRGFIKSYLGSRAGTEALSRQPFRNVWKSNAIATAFKEAIQ